MDPRMPLTILALFVMAVLLFRLAARVTVLERRIEALQAPDAPAAPVQAVRAPLPEPLSEPVPEPVPEPVRPSARVVRSAAVPVEHIAAPALPPPPEPMPQPPPAKTPAASLESLIGGKLPIWIGGVALILSGFFLVRFSIESGLLGPGVRSGIGALFGIALLAGSEAARRLKATADDPRIAQALAGAGVASLYGTLYMAAELYGLVGAGLAFTLMAAITLAALGLSLRHGPPTAIMGLVGGFVAPFVAGIDPASVVPLLVYLALFTAGLFALAIHRGWTWLALAATGGGLIWPLVLMALAAPAELQWVGLFVILLAVAATLALPRAGASHAPLRLAPLVVGLIQLVLLAPQLHFSPLSWGLYGLLAAAALALAWRDPRLTPGAGAALGLMLVLLVIALFDADPAGAPLAALGFTLLFGGAGHALARRTPDGRTWTAIALAATAGPLLLVFALADSLPGPWPRALIALAAALAAAHLSWRCRDEANAIPRFSLGLVGGAATAAVLAIAAAAQLLDWIWSAAMVLAAATALAAWARATGDRWLARVALVPLPLAALAWSGAMELATYPQAVLAAAPCPPLAELAAFGLLPALLLAATAWLMRDRRTQGAIHWAALLVGLTLPLAILPAPFHAIALALLAAACALPAVRRLLPRNGALAPILATFAAMLPQLAQMAELQIASLAGDHLLYPLIPPLGALLREIGLPAALLAGLLWFRPALFDPRLRIPVLAATGTALAAILYALAKQPLAIASDDQFLRLGMLERALITQALFAAGWAALAFVPRLRTAGLALLAIAAARLVWFDLLLLSPLLVPQQVGGIPLVNLAFLHPALAALWLRLAVPLIPQPKITRAVHGAALLLVAIAAAGAVRQLTHGTLIDGFTVHRGENYLYSAALLGLSLLWLARGIVSGTNGIRRAGLALLTLVTLKVFLVDAAALEGILRILSFLGLGLALIAIGWAYGKFMKPPEPAQPSR